MYSYPAEIQMFFFPMTTFLQVGVFHIEVHDAIIGIQEKHKL